MTPGDYIRRRREAREASIGQIEAILTMAGRSLSRPLAEIEADAGPMLLADAAHLEAAIDFDITALAALAAGEEIGICRICACSDCDPCEDPGPCSWVTEAEDLCSACQVKELTA